MSVALHNHQALCANSLEQLFLSLRQAVQAFVFHECSHKSPQGTVRENIQPGITYKGDGRLNCQRGTQREGEKLARYEPTAVSMPHKRTPWSTATNVPIAAKHEVCLKRLLNSRDCHHFDAGTKRPKPQRPRHNGDAQRSPRHFGA